MSFRVIATIKGLLPTPRNVQADQSRTLSGILARSKIKDIHSHLLTLPHHWMGGGARDARVPSFNYHVHQLEEVL